MDPHKFLVSKIPSNSRVSAQASVMILHKKASGENFSFWCCRQDTIGQAKSIKLSQCPMRIALGKWKPTESTRPPRQFDSFQYRWRWISSINSWLGLWLMNWRTWVLHSETIEMQIRNIFIKYISGLWPTSKWSREYSFVSCNDSSLAPKMKYGTASRKLDTLPKRTLLPIHFGRFRWAPVYDRISASKTCDIKLPLRIIPKTQKITKI